MTKEKHEKFLPIGSVVILKGAKKRLMIHGYATIDMNKKDKVYDYVGCMYPEGIISSDQSLLFNHEDIDNVFFLGYRDEEGEEFNKKLNEIMTKENIKKMIEEVNKSDK